MASQPSWTPGPWRYDAEDRVIYGGPVREDIAQLLNRHLERTHAANARLIAAAPDLYEACRALVAAGAGEAWDDDDPDLIQGRAALAKATGVEP